MTSSMIMGEKKWASARRSGMTVLGKVAVPKPLNLPSQKLENHGLDPNVEIVPKGTLSWGSHSSSVPNAWGSLSVSPNADGSTGSPSHLSGRPSSGSGTRPSTAGSDRAQDLAPNVWGPSSRPSSASGALTSNQTALTSLRPRSAETRPGSSQLSRFAEPPPDNSVAWGPNGASNKLGVTPSNKDGFSLSSGDFPTLGSEKDVSGKNIDSQEYGDNNRPGSSFSEAASGKEKNLTSSVGNIKDETANTWTRDGTQHTEYGVHPTAERWHSDMPLGGNHHRPPQHFDAWHGPPMNRPPGGWYRGPPGGPPYGVPLHPSGFPMEPFPFYRPQMPLNSSQQVPPGATPRGHHPKNGELCRPHLPEGYIHPRMPINPGFYPAPMAYEGFYGPPMSYCNPNERDMPLMGMPPGPPVYKRHPYEKAIDPHSRSPVHVSRGRPSTPERMASRSGLSDDTQGPYKVLLKQTNDWDEKIAEEEWDHGVPSNVLCIEKDQPLAQLQKNEWGLEDDQGTYPLDSAKLPERRGKASSDVDILGNKSVNESNFSQSSQVLSASPKGSNLMQKIDGLNAKARNVDGRPDVSTLPCKEVQYNQPHTSGMAPSRRPSQGAQGRVDHSGKRLNNEDVDGWRKKPLSESGKSELNVQGKDEDHSTLFVDESDSIAQRAKMREIAKQRAEKLQKEEEERTREQKAKALARLEELNRRALIVDASSQKLEKAPLCGTAQQEEEKYRKSVESNTDCSKSETSSSAVVQNRKDQIRVSNSIMVGENTVVFDGALLKKLDNVHPKSEMANTDATSQVSDGSASKHKQMESKQRQNVNSAKGVTEKSVPVMQTGAPNLKAANAVVRSENIAIEVGLSGEHCLVTSSNLTNESSMHQKRKNNRGSKNKHKVDEVAPISAVPSTVAKETNAAKASAEKGEQDSNVPQSKAVAHHPIQDLEQRSSLIEETSGKVSHQWKPQQPRRMPKNQQGNYRMGEREKSHSSETVTWAPVRSQNKSEPMDKPGDKAEPGIHTTNAKVEGVLQNNLKTKRAEMERYIPKPAKELAQQGSIQQPVVAQNIDCTGHNDSDIADAKPTAESKNGDCKQNKPSKARGWKQRVYAESSPNQGLQEAGKNVQAPIEQSQPLKSDVTSKEQTTDGWNSNDNSDASVFISTAVMKGQGVPGRGKRHPFKGNRGTGNSFEVDHGNASSVATEETPSESAAAPEMNQMDKNNALKENRFGGELTPQWQPKTQVSSVHTRRNRHSEGQLDAAANKAPIDQSYHEPVKVETAQNVVHQDFKRDKKPASSRGRPHSPNVSPDNITAEPETAFVKSEQHFVSGFRKNGNHHNRSGRGHDPRGDASYNREKPRQISHFEYQPIGLYGNNKPSNLEGGSTEGLHNVGPKYRERNLGYPRRGGGNFYGWQSGAGHGDARYD